MSMVICDKCERFIDSDEDGDCFTEEYGVVCDLCREDMEDGA
jgi:hypothetical protein